MAQWAIRCRVQVAGHMQTGGGMTGKAGKIENVERVEGEEQRRSADVIDLTELLKRSLGGKPDSKTKAKPKASTPRKSPKTARK